MENKAENIREGESAGQQAKSAGADTPAATSAITSAGRTPFFKKMIIGGFFGLILVFTFFFIASRNRVVVKGQDDAVVKALQKEAAEQSARQNNEILQQIQDLKQQVSSQRSSQQPPADMNAGQEQKLENISKSFSILPDFAKRGHGPDRKNDTESTMVEAPKKPSLLRKDLSMQTDPRAKGTNLASNTIENHLAVKKIAFLPAGTMVEGIMVTGAFAPVKGSPPSLKAPTVLIRLTRNAITANFHTFPLKDAFVLAEAEGIWNLSRVQMETKKIVMVLKDGRVIEKNLTGQIQGADHIDGVDGEVVNPGAGQRMLKFMGGSAVSGFFAGLADSETNYTTNVFGTSTQSIKDNALFGLATGMSKTWDNFSQWYLEQMKQMTPFVVASPGSKVYLLVQDGVNLDVDEKEI